MITFFLLILGLSFGSFISALAQQKDQTRNQWQRRSSCPYCGQKIMAKDLVPIVSFILLKGRCRQCRKPIGWHEPITELIVGFLFVLIGLAHQNTIDLFLFRDIIFTIFFALLFLIDLYHGLLPFKFTLAGTAMAIIFNMAIVSWDAPWHAPTFVLGAVICGGFFYLQHLISHGRWVGGGDIGMGLFIGAALGLWPGIIALGLAYVIGAIISLILITTKKATIKSQIPFGPFLSIGGWVIMFLSVFLRF